MTQGFMDNGEPKTIAKAWLAAIVESSDDAIISKTLEGIITSWNAGAQRIFGYTAAEAIGKSITMLIPPDRIEEEPQILKRIHAGERVDHFETVRMCKDGRLLDVSVTISPIRAPDGKIVGASKIARDITQQKRLERELRAAKEEADAANSAKDRFLSVLSHELRTPLTPVLAAISLIEENPVLSQEELRQQVEMMRRNVETEARLVDDLLDLTRIARGKVQLHFEAVDFHAVLRNAALMFQKEIEKKGLAVTMALRARDSHVWADPGRFQQIFMNLLSNAIKFTPDGGSIRIATRSENGHLIIEISDSGVGIESDVLPRLFSPFEQGEQQIVRRFGGLGLGLSIVKSLVEMHGGSIAAASAGTDKGATFTLSFPTIPADRKQSEAPPPLTQEKKTYRILLVEDHEDTRLVLSRLLSNIGCIVTTAGSVKEALELAETTRFDLLVSDLGLPDGSGIDVMKQLNVRQQVRGIALTGFGQDEDVRRTREAGFETHLTKPVNFQTLADAVRKNLG